MSSPQFKVVLLGDSGVGKSSLLARFVTDSFTEEWEPTIGTSFMSKQITLRDKTVKFNIWDTAGQERYHALTMMYYRDASVVIFVYDLDHPDSLQSLKRWNQEIKEHGPKNIVLAMAANKEDLEPTDDSEGQNLAREFNALYKRTSAKTSVGVEQLFRELAEMLLTGEQDRHFRPRAVAAVTVKKRYDPTSARSSCCCRKDHN